MDERRYMTSIVIVEDDVQVRNSLAEIVRGASDLELLAVAEDFASGSKALHDHQPDILLVDLGLPDGSGIDIIKQIADNGLSTEAIVISGFHDEYHVFKALEAGARGYVLKHDLSQKILDGIHLLLNGGAPISPLIARLMLQRFSPDPLAEESEPLNEELTERQLKILKLVSQGYSSREIAKQLNISYYTVTTHIKNIYQKLEVNSRTAALHRAKGLGLIAD